MIAGPVGVDQIGTVGLRLTEEFEGALRRVRQVVGIDQISRVGLRLIISQRDSHDGPVLELTRSGRWDCDTTSMALGSILFTVVGIDQISTVGLRLLDDSPCGDSQERWN